MPVIARSPEGKVVSLWGTALIRGADGQLRVLKVGDLVRKGDQILTAQNGIVQISNGDAGTPAAVAKAPVEDEVDRAIAELNSGDRQAAPAAGLTGGEGGSLDSALRVGRISEGLGTFEVPRASADAGSQAEVNATGSTVAQEDPAPATALPGLGVPSSAISAAEEGSTANLGLAAPTGPAANGSIRVDQVPAVGEIRKADGTLVTAGTVLTPADLPGLVYVPPADYDGSTPVGDFGYTLTVDGQAVTGGTRITLAAVNDPPVATPATVSGNEDGTLPVSLGGTDVDGRIVGVSVTSIPAGAALLLADGVTPVLAGQTLTPEQAATLLFRPAADFAGDQSIVFTVTDNAGDVSAPAAVSLTVVAVNDLPVPAAGSGGSGSEDSPVAVRLGGTDVDGSVTAVTVTSLPANGTLFLADGVTPVVAGTPLTPAQAADLVFVPNPDFNGNVGIGFTVTDNAGATSAPASAVVTVAPVNDGPVAGADSASFAEDSIATGSLLANDADVDGPTLSVASFVFGGVSFPAGSTAIVGGVGTLVIHADGSWSFTPAPDFNGPVPAIQVTTTDGNLSATSTLTLTVTPVNDAPLAQADLASTPINTPATIAVLANDSDAEGESLSVTGASVADPSQGSVTVNADGTLGFAPALNFTGTATITYTVRDTSGASSTATVTVSVGNNSAPDGSDVTRSLPEDGSYTVQAGDFGYTDADAGQTLASVRIDSLPAAGVLLLGGVPVTAGTVVSLAQLGAGALVFAPAADGNGAPYASFGFSVQDSSGAFDTTPNTFRFDVTPVNDAPVAAVDAASTDEDAALTLTLATLLANDSDVDGDALTITSVQGAVNGSVALVGGNVLFTPAANYAGPASFTYTVFDGNGGTATATVNLTVNAVGDAAVISSGAGSVTEDSTVVGGNLSTGGTLTLTDPDAGEASFQAQTVNGAYGSFTLAANGAWTYVASNTNPAIQALGAGDTLTETFTVTSADGTTSSVVVTINGTNDAAVISAGTGSVTEDVGVVGGNIATGGTLTIVDPDAGQASFNAQTTAGTYGSFALAANGVWTYTAANTNPAIQALGTGDTLTETFTVTSADGTTSSVIVTINGTNDGPVAQTNVLTTDEDTALTIAPATLLANDSDVDGDALTIASVQGAVNGTVALVGGDVVFTPAANYNGPASFTYTVSDGNGGASTATVTLAVNPVNDLPTASADSASTAINTALPSIAVLANDSDADGDTLTVTSATLANPALGSVSINPDGTLAFTPALNVAGLVTIDYTISDGHGGTSSATVSVNVGANTAPTGADASVTIPEDGSRNFAAADFGFADADVGQTLAAVRIDTLPAAGTLTFGGAPVAAGQVIDAADLGLLVFAPAPNANGNAYAGFTFSVQDSAGGFDSVPNSIAVNVTPAPDAAVIGGVASGATVEDTTLTTGGQLLIADPDAGEAAFQPQVNAAGTYGSLTIDAGGTWTYALNNADPVVQSLAQGESRTDTFTVRSIDGTPQLITITLTGTNDAAVISAGVGSVAENFNVVAGNLSTGGTLTVTDADAGEATFTAQTTAGAYGSFALAANGAWTYLASNTNPAIQALGAGDTLTETFTVTSADGSTSSVVVTINGTDDAAVISAGTGLLTEDLGVVGGNIATGGTLTVTDADAGQASFQAQASTAGAYGTFTLGTNGAWTYTATNANPAIQALGTGQTLTETFTVRSTDGTTSSVVVTINGTNDVAVISAGVGSITEDLAVSGGNIATGGTLTVTDADAGQGSFQAQASTAGSYGTFTLGSNGAWTYTASNINTAIQALGSGDTLIETFTVTSADGTTSSVVVTINGTNDVAVISAGTGSVTEDVGVVGGNIATGGTLTVSDADSGEAGFTDQTTAGIYGSFTLAANGVWSYTASNSNPAIQALGTGQTLTETFTVRSTDGTTSSVVVTINGTNDVAVISAGTSSVTEDVGVTGGNIATGGTLTVTDADASQASFQAQASTAGTYGTFTLAANGTWTYVASNTNPAIQALGAGQTLTETFTVRSTDGTTSAVVVSINGTNDAAVISAGTGSVTEDVGVAGGNIATGGTLTINDADSGEANFTAQTTAGTYGSFTLAANGAWTYVASNTNPAIQGLGAGDTLTETFTVTSADGTMSSVVVTINGTNDAAVISAGTGSITEDVGVVGGNISTGGTLTITDPDSGEASFTAQTTAGAYGSFTLATDGAWTYVASNTNPAIQGLGAGDTLTETFTVTSADGTMSSVVVTINGTNDAAVISAGTGSMTEDVGVVGGNIATAGTLTISDADSSEASFNAQTTAGTYGSFTLAANGVWTYTALNSNSAIQALGAGDTLTETFTVTSADGTTSSVVVTINGTNDAAVISAGTGSVSEDVGVVGGTIATGGTLTISDADSGEAGFAAQTTAGTYGSFALAANGAWTYVASNTNPAIQALGTGSTLTETFTVISADGTTSSVVVTINGTNDAAVISAGTGSITEDVGVVGGNISTGGTLTITDPDSGEASFTAQTTAGAYGTFTLAANGTWTYTTANANPAIQALGTGQTLSDTFTVRSTDGTTSSVVVTINGTNDAAVISAGTGSVTEDVGVVAGNIATGGTLTVTDADAGQASFQAQASTAGTYGSFTLGTNGAWTYTAANSNPAVQALGVGQTLTETFTVRSTDGTTSTVVVTINGTNDAAVISAGTGSVAEDMGVVGGNITTGGTLTVTDADTGQAGFQAQASTAGTYGTFTLGTNGAWTYTAANTNPAIQALGTGQTLTETFSVRSTDGTTSSVVVAINGTNDAPVAQAATFSVAEDAAIVNGAVVANDIDTGATHTFALNGAAPAGLSFNGDGSYSFDPSNAAYQSLAAGQTQLITVPYTVTDNAGATSSANLVITVMGVDDSPTIGGPLTGTVREDTTLTATGTLTVADVDAGQSSFVARTAVAGTYGSFSISTGGVWTYTLDNAAANVQALPAGSSVTESFVVTSADGTPRTVVVAVEGINDAPLAQAASFSVAEDAAIVNGAVTATDVDTGSTLSFALDGAAPAGLSFNSNGSYSFDPTNAAYQSLGAGQSLLITVPYTVTDNSGATSTASLVITVTGTDDVPTATGSTVNGMEDSAVVIGWFAFGVSDVDSATLSIQLTSLPTDGTLQYFNGSAWVGTTANQIVSRTDIDAGRLRFVPDANESGDGSFAAGGVGNLNQDYAHIGFRPYDGSSFGASASVDIDVQPVADAPTLQLNPVPPSLGLTLQFYDNVATVSPSNAGSTSTVETALEALAPTSTSQTTNLAVASVGVDDAYRATGYIYLQAGNTYSLSGYRDDTLLAKIGGTTVYSLGYNNYGNFSASGFTPSVSGYYSFEVVMYNGDGPGALDINLAVNGGTPVDLSTANFSLYPDAASLTATGTGTAVGSFVANNDGGYFPQRLSGPEDGTIRLGALGVSQPDADGSETLTVSVSGLQLGGTLTDGSHSFTATAGNTSVALAGWDLANLQYRAPADFNGNTALTISATTSEPNGSTATTTLTLPIDVIPVNDAPVGMPDTATVNEGSSGALASVLVNDTDLETAASGVAQFAASAGGSAVTANGVNTITTALGGTVVMNADGSYRYFAPAVSHGAQPVVDSFAYRPTDGSATGNWTTVSVTLNDSTPSATNDAGTVAWNSSVSGNLLTNDAAIDAAKSLVSINGVAVSASGTTTLTLANGTLQVAADGAFTYTSNQAASGTAGGSSETAWRGSVDGLWGFTNGNWSSGGNLNVTALATQPDLVNYQGGSKPGIEVGNSGIEFGENLIVQLPESSTQATVSLSQLNASQPTATWFAYDGSGNLVGSGTFAAGPSNGSASLQTITTATPFEYLRFTNTLSGGQGFLVSTVQYNKLASTHVDTVSYTMQDGDGDTSVAMLTLTPGTTSNFTTSLPAGTAGDDSLAGTGSADALSGSDGQDQLRGLGGSDALNGGNGNDLLSGGAGNDILIGGAGNDILLGGTGNDSLTGGGGADVFQWQLADRGTAGTPAVDTITDFNASAVSAGGDVLDLRDLLQGETLGGGAGDLVNYLHFSTSGGTTTIQISSSGAFTGSNYGTATDQTIVLQNVNLFSGGLTTDQQVIQDLLNKSKLVVDIG